MNYNVNNVTDSSLFQVRPLSVIICILIIFLIMVGGMVFLRSIFEKQKGKKTYHVERRETFTKKDEKAVMLIKSIADVYKAVDDQINIYSKRHN